MPTLTRKQREMFEREELILSTAQTLLYQHGYNYLTMDRVAETVEYSKGTIYNHFASKEDLICSLCCRSINGLINVFERAYQYPGTTRERYCAIGIGYSLYHQRHPMDTRNIQTLRNNAVREKISDNRLKKMESLEQKLTHIASSIVQQAIDCDELDKKFQANISTIVFGGWSMHYGALLLDQSDMPLQDMDFNPMIDMLWQNANILLDGYQWLPLSADTDTDKLFEKLSSALFDDETELLKQAV